MENDKKYPRLIAEHTASDFPVPVRVVETEHGKYAVETLDISDTDSMGDPKGWEECDFIDAVHLLRDLFDAGRILPEVKS